MKKLSLICLVLFVLSLGAQAQKGHKGKSRKSESKGYYAFSLGPSLPLGDYADNSITNDEGGFAKLGLHINLANVGVLFTQNIGFSGLVMAGANNCDAEAITGFKDKDSYWVYGGLMVGPLVSFDVSNELTLDIRPVAGLVMASSPEVNDDDGDVLIKSARATGFGFNIGTGLRYHINDNVDLGMNLDYFSTKQTFKPEYDGIEGEWKQQMSVLGITFGAAFGF